MNEEQITDDPAVDNDRLITRAPVGQPFLYHEGYLFADREKDAAVDSRAMTAYGLYRMGKVSLTEARVRNGVYWYYLTPRDRIKLVDCENARKLMKSPGGGEVHSFRTGTRERIAALSLAYIARGRVA